MTRTLKLKSRKNSSRIQFGGGMFSFLNSDIEFNMFGKNNSGWFSKFAENFTRKKTLKNNVAPGSVTSEPGKVKTNGVPYKTNGVPFNKPRRVPYKTNDVPFNKTNGVPNKKTIGVPNKKTIFARNPTTGGTRKRKQKKN